VNHGAAQAAQCKHWEFRPRHIVFVMRDDSTRRIYRLYDFTKSQQILPRRYYCVSGKVNSADKLYLVIESIKPDTKHSWSSTAPALSDGAEE